MRTFRITLSHGTESITFDGAGARSGSMFHVRRNAIEGLWSSPASKVSLTERETANGASPISDGETLYAARTVVIPFAIQSNYNHTDLIRARILLGRLIGWHDVRMDINDDGDETVLFGYVEAKYSNIPYDHADTGTITMVCPDPRRVSKHASTVTMNTSSSSLGGLSFGRAYELAWTGTANNSTSTLSQDGQVVAKNLDTTADCLRLKIRDADTIKAAQNTDGTWTYTTIDGLTSRWIMPVLGVAYAGLIVFAQWAETEVQYSSTDGTVVASGPGWVAFAIDDSMKRGIYFPVGVSFTLLHSGIYTQSDWQAMQSRGIMWFDGDSQSPQPNAGLVFPLNFGQTGNTGNTGMIANNGSYVAMPVITAHGWLDSGLTIHWATSDGNEGDLSYKGSIQNVPVTINTDTHSAIMGGLDVSYLLGSRDWPRIPAGGSCSFALLASGDGWVTVQSHDTYM